MAEKYSIQGGEEESQNPESQNPEPYRGAFSADESQQQQRISTSYDQTRFPPSPHYLSRPSLTVSNPEHVRRYHSARNASPPPGGLTGSQHSHHSVYHLETEYEEDLDEYVHTAPSRLVQRQREQATMFGMPKWKAQVRKKAPEERSQHIREILEGADVLPPPDVIAEAEESERVEALGMSAFFFSRGNLIYSILFGWLVAFAYLLLAGIMFCTVVGKPYGIYSWRMVKYHLWPFGKYVCQNSEREQLTNLEEETHLLRKRLRASEPEAPQSNDALLWVWRVFFVILVAPFHLLVGMLCWMVVVLIPVAKMNWKSLQWSLLNPLHIEVIDGYPGAGRDVIICTYKAANTYYYKYTVGGMNIILVNLLPFVFFSLIVGYVLPPLGIETPSMFRLILSLFSIIPLTYYIGTAISSLSAQTESFAAGAVLNATFGSICELIIYCIAIASHLDDLVQAGVTGSLLGVMLLLPGLSMLVGGIKYKEQRFSRSAAGVSSVLLFLSVVAAFVPTLFFLNYGAHSMACGGCTYDVQSDGFIYSNSTEAFFGNCDYCYSRRVDLKFDPVYLRAEALSFASAVLMPIAYCVGLFFTLKTHTHIYDFDDEDEEHGGHDAPEWPKWVCCVILLVCTMLFAALAEELLDALQPTLDQYGIPESFAGLTIIAVIPNTAEIVNAVQFSLQGNFALSLEIGSSAAVQIALIQIPILLIFSVIINGENPDCGSFTLVFPTMDMIAVIFSTLILTFVAFEGKSNYFTGTVLLLVYLMLVVTFWFIGQNKEADESLEEFYERVLSLSDKCT
eukprot:CAMPEP_0201492962 /NCGR_PEP_ID=MMETSP0151_2-20130828/35519_1 /ASSEMBLY_ACC=CAM_ASM_000257 /TAXON_ID=200890 /ORGANISM="Paramoeba atlantica, Strain 621/1 / CCAP 1560/9" /LENGTH=791 /DNA_ID=CAMNT_0047880069 /DNA_START=89 /DNA_END=2464 /DNA_ORIENTATION=+